MESVFDAEGVAFVVFLTVVSMVGIWNNWIWIGKDGYNLSWAQRPGFFCFWFVVGPKYLWSVARAPFCNRGIKAEMESCAALEKRVAALEGDLARRRKRV